jgi:hypothetical protein
LEFDLSLELLSFFFSEGNGLVELSLETVEFFRGQFFLLGESIEIPFKLTI